MNDNILKINHYPFADKYLQNLIIDRKNDQVKLTFLSSENDIFCKITAHQIIGTNFIGYWDEWIIDSVHIQKGGDYVSASLATIKKNHDDHDIPFMQKHMNDSYYQLSINLIDGMEIQVAAKIFELEDNNLLNKENL